MGTKVWAWLRGTMAPEPGATPNLFAASSAVLGVSAVYLYFTGYIFCYAYYYWGFGVTLESLDLSPQFYFVRAYTVLATVRGALLICGLVLIIVAYVGGKLRRGLVLLALAAAFPGLYYVSKHVAEREFNVTFCTPTNTIQFQFKEPDKAAAKDPAAAKDAAVASAATTTDDPNKLTKARLMEMGDEGKLSLLLETKDRIVIYKIPHCSRKRGMPEAQVYTILRGDLNFTNVLR